MTTYSTLIFTFMIIAILGITKTLQYHCFILSEPFIKNVLNMDIFVLKKNFKKTSFLLLFPHILVLIL